MLYSTLTVNDKDYKLRLSAKASVDLERSLGANPLSILMEVSETNLPSLEVLIKILHASLQAYQHGMTIDDAYNLYDQMVDSGYSLETFLPVIIEIFKVSGFIKDKAEKN